MTALDLLRENAGRQFRDEDGNGETFTLLPPLSADELKSLADGLPCALPVSMRELLSVTRGWTGGPLESVDLSGLNGGFGMEEIFPHALSIAHDGYGNYWVVDLLSTSTKWGPIYYACHDPPVIVYQCADLEQFIRDVLTMIEPPFKGPIDEAHEGAVDRVWKENPGIFPVSQAIASMDPELNAFGRSLPSEAFVADLRRARLGDGFSWGRFGPRTKLFRHGESSVFAYASVPAKNRFITWLTGR
ncbi:MAG TPA: SMI1/KNR4 family protein [Gemmatimonadaceae bacterium]|nr:SMI1/KNR4 family protein [Gemmatimonadaceae bacterium]